MKYQLVLQWPLVSMKEFDAMIEVEDVLIEKLSETNEVDGHDAGTDEVNIFIRTDNPKIAFDEIKGALGNSAYWTDVKVAYREVSKDEYTVLWPKGLDKFNVT